MHGLQEAESAKAHDSNVSSAIQTQLNAKQGLNAKLTDLAGLAVTANNFIAGDGSNFVLKTADLL